MIGGIIELRPLDDGTWSLMVIRYRSRQAAIISREQYVSLIMCLCGEGNYVAIGSIRISGLVELIRGEDEPCG
jgi:hypothetical protein